MRLRFGTGLRQPVKIHCYNAANPKSDPDNGHSMSFSLSDWINLERNPPNITTKTQQQIYSEQYPQSVMQKY